MELRLLELLACPCCGGALQLIAIEREGDEVTIGSLRCHCGETYAIEGGIPFLLAGTLGRARNKRPAPHEAAAEISDLPVAEREKVTLANIYFHNQMASDYEQDRSTKGIFSASCQHRIREAIAEMRSRTTGDVFLDIGCGTGNILQNASGSFRSAMGMDVSPEMLSVARRRGLRVLGGSADSLPFRSGSIEAVSVFSVLHHLYDPKAVLAQIARVLKPGGVLYTDWDPNGDARRRLARVEWVRVAYGRGVGLLSRTARALGLPVRTHLHTSEQEPLVELTEYHDRPGVGLDGEELRGELLKLGFRDVRVIPHWNNPSFRAVPLGVPRELPRVERLKAFARMTLTMTFDPEALAPLLLILAQK
jgi:ubiquinone/menaquinone biosynthesis C-methylase UbiE/uncharacterized protein YbaR (Trm112 family)